MGNETDREMAELLELAAKAAGIKIHWSTAFEGEPLPIDEHGDYWVPHLDDGDALRLAVKLRLSIMLAETSPEWPEVGYWDIGAAKWEYVRSSGLTPEDAVRRCIVRAAAALAQSSKSREGEAQ